MLTDIDSVKNDPSILSVFRRRLPLKKDGKEFICKCVFHSEKTASLRVYKDATGTWLFKCFGCNEKGNIIQLVEKVDGLSFKDAVKKIQDELSGSFSSTRRAGEVFSSLSEQESISYPLSTYKKYEDALADPDDAMAKGARSWLKSRGIEHETAKALHLGLRADVGKLHPKSFKAGWVAFPSIMGDRVLSIKYRAVNEKEFCKQSGMARGDLTPLFNSDTIDPLEAVFVTEGELDAAVLEQAGYKAVSVQSSSTPATAANKERLLEADYVVLAGDTDPQGTEYMNKLWAEMKERTFKLVWPCKDANETFMVKCKGDIKAFKELVDNLTIQAKSVPIPNISSLQEVMLRSGRVNLIDHPNRLQLPWKVVDQMAVLVPGSVCSIMATSTKQGKSTFVMQATIYAALKGDVVLNYQCELSPEEFSTMVTAHILRKDRNHLSKEQYKQASEFLGNIRYYIGRDPTLSTVNPVLDLIEAGIRRLGATVVVLDHIHFICRNEANEIQAQANAMQKIKRLAVQYGVKFIVVGQPRKADQKSKGKLVDISDFKGSEAGTSDADAVFAIHRDRILERNENTQDDYDPLTTVHLLGCRSRGDGGVFAKLLYTGKTATFEEVTNDKPPEERIFKS